MSLGLSLSIGIPFGLIASGMSFLITYQEYSKRLPDRRQALWSAVRTAVVTFVFFLVLTLLAGRVLSHVVGGLQ